MTALLAREMLREKPGKPVVYDLRSSWVVKEEIEQAGGSAVRDRVGHSFIKATMRQNGAIFGGELSGHFYFADNYVCDSGEIAFVSALSMLSRGAESLSKRAQALRRYHASGEINFHVEDKDGAIARLRETYKAGRQDMLDGITVVTLEHAIAAPFCTRQLADLGARVIKIERPGSGDFARGYDERVHGLASHFVWTNRAKASLGLRGRGPGSRWFMAATAMPSLHPHAARQGGHGGAPQPFPCGMGRSAARWLRRCATSSFGRPWWRRP